MTLGNRMRKRRKNVGIGQSELARQSGVSRVTIAEMERGTRTVVNTDTILAIARALGTSVDYLLGTWEDENLEEEDANVALVGV